jgi:isoleucyl-tRNA synthetase
MEAANKVLGLNQQPLPDLHRPYIDEVVLVSPSGKPMRRELDLIDVWFDSGSMPYAQWADFAEFFKEKKSKTTPWQEAHPVEMELLREYAFAKNAEKSALHLRISELLKNAPLSRNVFEEQTKLGEIPLDFACPEKRLAVATGTDAAELRFLESYLLEYGYKLVQVHQGQSDEEIARLLHRELCARPVFTEEELEQGVHLNLPFGGSEGSVFPADFIAEGVDQTRGWFYTLHAIASMLYDSVAFKAVVSNGLVLDKNGNKMSKSKGNVVNPFDTMEANGADATRWYMLSNASPWDNLKFATEGIEATRNKLFITLYNTYSFFALYANIDAWAWMKKT